MITAIQYLVIAILVTIHTNREIAIPHSISKQVDIWVT